MNTTLNYELHTFYFRFDCKERCSNSRLLFELQDISKVRDDRNWPIICRIIAIPFLINRNLGNFLGVWKYILGNTAIN